MTALSTDGSYGAIYNIQVEEIPISTHGNTITYRPNRLAIVHCDVDTQSTIDTLDLNTYVNGTVNEIRGLLFSSTDYTYTASNTFSGTTITFAGHGGGGNTSATHKFSAVVELK